MTVSRDYYYKLASDLEAERIEAARSLLSDLVDADSQDEYKYTLDRLLKGLSSSRASARIGFSTCLTELLSILFEKNDYTVADYMNDLDQKVKANITKANGKNERAILFGKLFGYQAVLNSESFEKSSLEAKSQEFIDILMQIIDLSLVKSWIRETCFVTIFQALLQKKVLPFPYESETNRSIMKAILRKLDECNMSLTSEGLLIYLGVSPSSRSRLVEDAVINQDKSWKEGNPLAKGNLPALAKVLKESGAQNEDQDNKAQKGNWQPRLHYVWNPLIDQLLKTPYATFPNEFEETSEEIGKKRSKHFLNKKPKKSKQPELVSLEEFWKTIVDEQFFSSNASVERKYWGFEILRLTMQLSEDSEHLKVIFSKNLMRSLINQTANADRFLNKIAKLVLDDIVELSHKAATNKVPLLDALLKSSSGSIHFDHLTKSKTCESILTSGNTVDERESLMKFFISWLDEVKTDGDYKKMQLYLVDQILLTVKSSAGDIASLLGLAFQSFAKYGYFIPMGQSAEDESTLYNSRMSQACQGRLKSLLTTLSSKRKGESLSISQAVDVIQSLESNRNFKLRLQFDDELSKVKEDAFAILNQIKSFSADNPKLSCFEALYSMTIVQIYSGDEESISLVPELNVAFDKQMSGNAEESNEILTDVMLTFLSQKSVLMKQLSLVIWEFLISNKINLDTINLLADILTTKENKEGQQKFFNNAEEEEEEQEEEGGSEGDEDSDDEHDHSLGLDDDNAGKHSSSEESDNDSESSNEMEEVDAKTNIALAEALGIPTSESGEVKFDSDDESEEESDAESMSDEQMMAIDSQLSNIFQRRKDAMDSIRAKSGNQRKLDVIDAKRNMIIFKGKVLDLLEKFNDTDNSSYLNVHLVAPLLRLIELTLDKQLGEKAHKLLKNKVCKSKIVIKDGDDISQEALFEMIKDIHRHAAKSSIKAHSLASNQASIFVSKVLVTNFGSDNVLNDVIDVYSSSLKSWSKNKSSKLQSTMFFDFINWINSRRN